MTERSRKTALVIIAAVLSLITIWIASGYSSMIAAPLINVDGIDNINIDGSDFTFFFKAGAIVLNGVIMAAFVVIMLALELVLTPTAWGILRYNAFKKKPVVSREELVYSRRVFLISSLGTLAVSLVFMTAFAVRAKSGAPFSALLFCWMNPLFMWVLYISKVKKSAA